MEIVDARSALLSNYEVLSVLREQLATREEDNNNSNNKNNSKSKRKNTKKVAENVKTIEFETLSYLNGSPSSTQTDTQVVGLTTALSKWTLTKAEKLQIVNIRPRQIVEIHMLIEECDERFDVDTLEEMLALVRQHLPRDDDEEEEEEEGEEGDEEAEDTAHDNDITMDDATTTTV
ncbi:RNA polymerase Rpb4-domain-containing protein [Syncephalis plumigaleata]|nr:RNA polymerase Rpb4-domain-containing protein [Syncephalis plumigaleata]